MVKRLISKGAKINAADSEGLTPLHLATYSGYADTATQLINKGARVKAENINGSTPLHMAAYNGKPEVVTTLDPSERQYQCRRQR